LNLLLDTHAFLWWIAGSLMLSRPARPAIGDAGNTVLVSAVSAWEITTKFRIGKLPGVAAIAEDLIAVLDAQGFVPLPVSFVHGQAAGALSGPLKDPFDRTLIPQAMLDRMAVVSNEHDFAAYGARRCGSAAIAYPSHTLLGIGNEANASSPSGWSGSTPAMRSSIIHCRTCWPTCQVVRSRYSCSSCGP
jgi:PIN domain nuclease of toxin-antitoxin system